MELLIKKAVIIDKDKSLNGEIKDILISKGRIQKIAKNISSPNAKKIESPNLHCSIGWCDIGTHLGEPGYEQRETTDSICEAASAGGYTTLIPFPVTEPIIQSASDLKYLKSVFSNKIQDVYPIAALSKNTTGTELTEMRDLEAHGAVAFGDGLHSVNSAGLMMKALQYASASKCPIIDFPQDQSLCNEGHIHEGEISISLGLKGIPSISESIRVNRNIALAKYTNSSLIIHAISSKKSVQMIKEARKKSMEIYATVPYLNLVSTHDDVTGFQVNYKVNPPLRTGSDQKALLDGLKEGTISAIVSNHVPLEQEKKMLEFTYASQGATGLETCFSGMMTPLGSSYLSSIIRALTYGPRNMLGIECPKIMVGELANLTLFDPNKKWTYDISKSLSKNNPFLNKEMTGKVVGIINGAKSQIIL